MTFLQVLIVDYFNDRLQRFRLDGVFVQTLDGETLCAPTGPCSVAIHNNEIFVVDGRNKRLQVVRLADGAFLRLWDFPDSQSTFPCGLAVTRAGQLMVRTIHNHYIFLFEWRRCAPRQ